MISYLKKCVFFLIFDTKICSILLYGAEHWGVGKQLDIERVQNYACKRYMGVPLNTNNDVILGDCGRYPMFIECVKRSISYWLKLLKTGDNKYARK